MQAVVRDVLRGLLFTCVVAAVLTACGDNAGDGSGPAGGSAENTSASSGTTTQASTSMGEGDTHASSAESGTTSNDESGTDTGGSSALTMYCDAAAAFVEACGETLDECDLAEFTACVEVFDVEREELLEARASCGFPDGCASPTSFEQRLCIHQATKSMTPTTTQTQLAETLCTTCLPDSKNCIDDAFFVPEPMKGSTGVGGVGTSVLNYTESVVAQLQVSCAPAAGSDCVQAFLDCRDGILDGAQPSTVTRACEVPEGPG
ncbi:MAG: hypothetical protein ACRBN8_25215 [Nannocystales bacterium]